MSGYDFQDSVESLTDISTVTSFARSATAPPSGATTAIASESGSVPIYIWMDGTALLWYTAAPTAYLNQAANNMFKHFSSITSISFDGISTGKVSNMSDMFMFCSDLTSLDLSVFNTSCVTNMDNMFSLCNSLRTILVSRAFVTDAVTSSTSMFGCPRLVGGAGTRFDPNHKDAEYARIDNPPTAPGYFTEAT